MRCWVRPQSTMANSKRFFEDIAGDIVFGMVSDIFREFNREYLIPKLLGLTSQQAQDMAIGEFGIEESVADDFQPEAGSEPEAGVSYVLIPLNFSGNPADFPVTGANFQFDTIDAKEAFAEIEAEDARGRERAKFFQVMNHFVQWLVDENQEVWKPEVIEPRSLNRYIGLFLMNLNRLNGKDMEPDPLTSYHRAIDR